MIEKGVCRKSFKEQAKTKILSAMKEFKKAQLIAKNLPTGSYAAGCPSDHCNYGDQECKRCERTA